MSTKAITTPNATEMTTTVTDSLRSVSLSGQIILENSDFRPLNQLFFGVFGSLDFPAVLRNKLLNKEIELPDTALIDYDRIHRLRVKLASEYGILIPVIRLRDQAGLAEDEYEIALHGRTVLGRGVLKYPMRFHIGEKAADETQLEGEEPVWHKAGVWRAAGTKQKTGASRPADVG